MCAKTILKSGGGGGAIEERGPDEKQNCIDLSLTSLRTIGSCSTKLIVARSYS